MLAAAVAGAALWALLGAERVETAPAGRGELTEVLLEDGRGVEAEVPRGVHAVVVATRRPTGELDVECADPEMASAMVYGVLP